MLFAFASIPSIIIVNVIAIRWEVVFPERSIITPAVSVQSSNFVKDLRQS